jgi:hypothetical protein
LVILCSTCSRIWEWWLLFWTKNQIDLELNTFQFITRLIDRCAFDLLVSDEVTCITSRLCELASSSLWKIHLTEIREILSHLPLRIKKEVCAQTCHVTDERTFFIFHSFWICAI